MHDLDLNANRCTTTLVAIMLLLLAAHLLGVVLIGAGVEARYATALIRRFDLDDEGNIPTFFNSLLLLLSAGLLLVATAVSRLQQDGWGRYWGVLAAVFAFLSIDEAVELHGVFSEIGQVLNLTGAFRFAWVVVYLPLLLVLGIFYLRFYIALAPATRLRVTIAALIYVGGAAGVEMIGGAWSTTHGEQNTVYVAITTIEEIMEATGMILFIRALLLHTRLELVVPAPARVSSGEAERLRTPA